MAYTGLIDLISGIRPKNQGGFPLVSAADVYVDDDTRLDAKLAAIEAAATGRFSKEIVAALPTSAIVDNRIYLMPTGTGSGAPNVYKEYMYMGDVNQPYSALNWEQIGSTEVNMTNYYNKEQVDSAISGAIADVEAAVGSGVIT